MCLRALRCKWRSTLNNAHNELDPLWGTDSTAENTRGRHAPQEAKSCPGLMLAECYHLTVGLGHSICVWKEVRKEVRKEGERECKEGRERGEREGRGRGEGGERGEG